MELRFYDNAGILLICMCTLGATSYPFLVMFHDMFESLNSEHLGPLSKVSKFYFGAANGNGKG